jgi:hypothetical protein
MAKRKASEKERTIESFSKDVLVCFIKQQYRPDVHRLRSIELDIEYKKLDAKLKIIMEESHKASGAGNRVKYFELQAQWERVNKRINRLLGI